MPGLGEFAALKTVRFEIGVYWLKMIVVLKPVKDTTTKWMKDLDKDDIDMLQELGSLNTAQLMDKVKELVNLAYQLGLEECN